MKLGRSIEEFEVGMKAEFSHTFTQIETETMADLIGDHNLFHYEGDFIKNTHFKKPIVHGLLVAGMSCHFGGDLFPGPGCLAESMTFNYLRPVYFGDTIRAVAEIIKIDRKKRRLTFHMNCFNEKKEKVLEGEITGLMFQVTI
ncbi:MAG: MaoC family dehydratase [Candidatus Thorarchaeota archaeon]